MSESTYDLETEKVCLIINKEKFKRVLIQLPDGLKPKADAIKREIENKTKAECLIWMGSCFGACDVPFHAQDAGVDFIVQWGHSEWEYNSNRLN